MLIYHRVPPKLVGSTLYPLNELRERSPRLYQMHVAKYAERRHVMKQRIPPLDCLWNDVLFFFAVNPFEFRNACEGAGLTLGTGVRYYAIDTRTLDRSKMAVWTYDDSKPEKEFARFDMRSRNRYARLPPGTISEYRKTLADGRNPLLWRRITHILYKGSVDVSGARIIET